MTQHLYSLRSDPTINLVPIRPHTQLLQCHWLCSLRGTSHPVTFYNWQFTHITSFHRFHPSPQSLLSGNPQSILCNYEFVSVLLVHLFCFLDSTYK